MPIAYKDLPNYTIEDYAKWEGNWELISGIPYAMTPSPLYTHQRTGVRISWQLEDKLQNCAHCTALHEIDWYVTHDTVLRPDNLVICYKPEGERLDKTPSVVFEIVSPNSARQDENIKFEICEREGVRYYILVYPENTVAKVYHHAGGKFVKIADATNDKILFDLGDCSFEFDFSLIWQRV